MSGPTGPREIIEALRRFQAGLEEPYKMTPAGMWACSDPEEVLDLFEQVDLGRFRHFCDLGSGDGRAVLLASIFTRASGVEADHGLVEVARGLAKGLGLSQACFIQGDCRQADLAPYDLLFLYPDKPLDWLTRLLPEDWPGHLLIYGPYFQPGTLTHVRTIYAGKTLCGLWRKK